jgi:hypothetical protein
MKSSCESGLEGTFTKKGFWMENTFGMWPAGSSKTLQGLNIIINVVDL